MRYLLNFFIIIFAPFVLLFFLYALYIAEAGNETQFYQFAWYALLMIVVLMELRVRLGYRTTRGKLFYLHIVSAIPFFISLGVLAFLAQPFWLIILSNILLVILGAAGVILFYRTTQMIPKSHT